MLSPAELGYVRRGPHGIYPARPSPVLKAKAKMYLLYVDESGNPDGKEDKYFVLGGIALYERRPYFLNDEVNKLEAEFFPDLPPGSIEFHAQAIMSHSEEPWKSLPSTKRWAILERLCQIITNNEVTLFGVAIEREIVDDPVTLAFEEISNRFDRFLTRKETVEGKMNRGLAIFDKSRYESRLQTLLTEYRSTGTRFGGKLRNFADVPLFADSKSTRLLQLADLVAYSVYRRYERADTKLLDKIVGRFLTEDGAIHGILHWTKNRSACLCPACLTRKVVTT
jgi:hypothetical protein